MDEPGTVFCLVPKDDHSDEVVCGKTHGRTRVDPNNPSKRFLRVGTDQPSNFPGNLLRFGRNPLSNDVILGEGWSKDDQCYFDYHPTSKELLLHDISSRSNTELWDKDVPNLLGKIPRICIVPLTREWNFTIGCANFRLIPSKTWSRGEVEAFTRPPVPEEYDGTYEDTLERLLRKHDLQSVASTSTHNTRSTRVRPRRPPKRGEDIKWAPLKPLGAGGQGDVYEAVDINTGEHYACKVVAFKGPIPQWNIGKVSEFKRRIRDEVEIVEKARHYHIVPYVHHQGWESERPIEIFMPVYEGNLQTLLERVRLQGEEAVRVITDRMFYQMLLVLDHIRAHKIIHRDIKPENILFLDDDFFLTDFGIAKPIDTAKTMAGTPWYMAPELWLNGGQTAEVDVYALGVTYIECLHEFPVEEVRRAEYPQWRQWHDFLQTLANQHEPRVAPMLANVADQRPTARDLLDDFFPQPAHALQGPQNGITPSSFGVSSPLTNQVNGTTMIYSAAPTPMEWTRTGATAFFQGRSRPTQRNESMQPSQPNPVAAQPPKVPPNRQPGIRGKGSIKSAKSVDERQKKGHKRGGSSQNTPSQSAGVPKRTSSRRQSSRSKSIHKAQEIRVLGIA